MEAIMGNYFLSSPRKNHLQISNSQKELLTELKRESCMNYKTSFTYKGELYRFVNENVWHTKYILIRGNETIAHISWKWTGAAFIELRSDSGEWYCFELKGKGFFDYKQTLVDEFREELLVIRPDTNWNNLSYTLSVDNTQADKSPVDFVWLLAMSVFCSMIGLSYWGVSLQAYETPSFA